jgi:ABC-type branched-subunit amino acid transport system permease subunit
VPVGAAILLAGLITAALGTLLIFPSFRLRGHYVTIATLGIGEIVGLVILNWEDLTRGPIGVSGIPPLELLGLPLVSARAIYWLTLAILIGLAALQTRLLGSHLGRTLRALRDDDIAARTYGIGQNPTRRWRSPSAASRPAPGARSPRICTRISTTRPSTPSSPRWAWRVPSSMAGCSPT